MTPVDAVGTVHRRHDDRATLRIVSLVPSLTELLFDLGLGDAVVARTGWCIHPAGLVDRVPKVGGTKSVNIDKIRKLAATHLVVDMDENEKPTVEALARFVPHVVVTHPRQVRDNVALYRLFGHVFACEHEADDLVARFDEAFAALDRARPRDGWPERRVLYLIWKDPWMTIGRDTYIASLLATIGWMQADATEATDRTAASSPRYPAIDLERAVRAVDLVLLSSEPYGFTEDDVAALRGMAAAVRRVDGEMLSWYGSRAILGLGYLRSLASGDASLYST